MLNSGPVFETDAGEGAIGEEGGFFRVLEDSVCCRYSVVSIRLVFSGGLGVSGVVGYMLTLVNTSPRRHCNRLL